MPFSPKASMLILGTLLASIVLTVAATFVFVFYQIVMGWLGG